MLDPIGLFAPRDAMVHHVLQTFHRHPVYDLVLLRAHEGGVEAMAAQARRSSRAPTRTSARWRRWSKTARITRACRATSPTFAADPHVAARPIPPGLVADPHMMLAMDQFKDVRGFARYAARLRVGLGAASPRG